jgi:hypothetical protein
MDACICDTDSISLENCKDWKRGKVIVHASVTLTPKADCWKMPKMERDTKHWPSQGQDCSWTIWHRKLVILVLF